MGKIVVTVAFKGTVCSGWPLDFRWIEKPVHVRDEFVGIEGLLDCVICIQLVCGGSSAEGGQD
jgi:hypothetical protein